MTFLIFLSTVLALAALVAAMPVLLAGMADRVGVLFNPNSWWIGCHYSPYNKRFCINLIPCITVWIIKENGKIPIYSKR